MFKTIVMLLLIVFMTNHAYANIALSKFRLYFDNSIRSDSIQLRNSGSVALTYEVELGLVAMTEEGALRKVEHDPFSAISLLRYSPKRGRIEAGERQALRFVIRKPAGLQEGEYRAVLLITNTPINSGAGSLSLRPKLTYSVPIIVRHGRLQAATELLEPKLVLSGDTPHIELWQTLTGNRSLFGNFTIQDANGDELGVLNNSAVYQPLNKRKVMIALNSRPKGKVTIKYQEIAKFGGNLQTEVETELK